MMLAETNQPSPIRRASKMPSSRKVRPLSTSSFAKMRPARFNADG